MSQTEENSPQPSSGETPVPQAVVNRLSLYLRELQHLVRDGNETASSTQIGKLLGFTDAQVRKDLAYFGPFGYPGVGYRCQELIDAIKKILGTNQVWPVVLIGTGNLGRALLGYRGFGNQGFRVVAAFDADAGKVGRKIDGIDVLPLDDLKKTIESQNIRIAILAVPSPAAQLVAEKLVEAGISGILNFAPVTLTVSKDVHVVGVDLAIELEQLAYAVVNRQARE
jgi:redox-sensing transcriptional repressor